MPLFTNLKSLSLSSAEHLYLSSFLSHLKTLETLSIFYSETENERVYEHGMQYLKSRKENKKLNKYVIETDSWLADTSIEKFLMAAIEFFKN
jgi:hypothetical protein